MNATPNRVDDIIELFATVGAKPFAPGRLSAEQHALQCAALAEESNAGESLVLASLLHDIGHLLKSPDDDVAGLYINNEHEHVGADWLATCFGPEICEPVRLHVEAKRYLCAVDPDYIDQLSDAQIRSLNLQGGPLTAKAQSRFLAQPYADDAIALRRFDQRANDPSRKPTWFESYAERLRAASQCLLA